MEREDRITLEGLLNAVSNLEKKQEEMLKKSEASLSDLAKAVMALAQEQREIKELLILLLKKQSVDMDARSVQSKTSARRGPLSRLRGALTGMFAMGGTGSTASQEVDANTTQSDEDPGPTSGPSVLPSMEASQPAAAIETAQLGSPETGKPNTVASEAQKVQSSSPVVEPKKPIATPNKDYIEQSKGLLDASFKSLAHEVERAKHDPRKLNVLLKDIKDKMARHLTLIATTQQTDRHDYEKISTFYKDVFEGTDDIQQITVKFAHAHLQGKALFTVDGTADFLNGLSSAFESSYEKSLERDIKRLLSKMSQESGGLTKKEMDQLRDQAALFASLKRDPSLKEDIINSFSEYDKVWDEARKGYQVLDEKRKKIDTIFMIYNPDDKKRRFPHVGDDEKTEKFRRIEKEFKDAYQVLKEAAEGGLKAKAEKENLDEHAFLNAKIQDFQHKFYALSGTINEYFSKESVDEKSVVKETIEMSFEKFIKQINDPKRSHELLRKSILLGLDTFKNDLRKNYTEALFNHREEEIKNTSKLDEKNKHAYAEVKGSLVIMQKHFSKDENVDSLNKDNSSEKTSLWQRAVQAVGSRLKSMRDGLLSALGMKSSHESKIQEDNPKNIRYDELMPRSSAYKGGTNLIEDSTESRVESTQESKRERYFASGNSRNTTTKYSVKTSLSDNTFHVKVEGISDMKELSEKEKDMAIRSIADSIKKIETKKTNISVKIDGLKAVDRKNLQAKLIGTNLKIVYFDNGNGRPWTQPKNGEVRRRNTQG